jgi:magnesium-transporting ATPase (P-type)
VKWPQRRVLRAHRFVTPFAKCGMQVIYRGMSTIVGSLLIKMKVGKRPRRALQLKIEIFANRMRARACEMTLHLTKSGFVVKRFDERFLY